MGSHTTSRICTVPYLILKFLKWWPDDGLFRPQPDDGLFRPQPDDGLFRPQHIVTAE